MDTSNPATSRLVEDVASRHGVSTEAVSVLLKAVAVGGGTMAQFSHPELGGMGQWSRGGMLMIGDMFNQGLKFRVDNLCNELSDALARDASLAPAQSYGSRAGGNWWPEGLGSPSSSGAQNDMLYAFFPTSRRLVIDAQGKTTTYDTGDHMISGVSQQQSGTQSLVFTSQSGTVQLEDLNKIGGEGSHEPHRHEPARETEPTKRDINAAPNPASGPGGDSQAAAGTNGHDEIFIRIERLADLRAKGILTDEEFATKKTELLARL